MKTIIGVILAATLSQVSFAGIKTRILHIDTPEIMGESYEILTAKNKSTIILDPSQTELIEISLKAEEYNSVVEIETEGDRLTSLKVIEQGDDIRDFYTDDQVHPMTNYEPTSVTSYDEATKMFKYLKKRSKWFTQCFNRAHVWSKQMYDRNQVDSMKVFIFYTKKYRREIKGKWWFHVAPMIDINGNYYVMDKEFTRQPTALKDWEYIFTKKMNKKGLKGYRCSVIRNIKEYYDTYNQNNEYCNILITSMHYWMPLDMSNLDKKGIHQTEWSNRDLKSAAREVFFGWREVYKEIKVK